MDALSRAMGIYRAENKPAAEADSSCTGRSNGGDVGGKSAATAATAATATAMAAAAGEEGGVGAGQTGEEPVAISDQRALLLPTSIHLSPEQLQADLDKIVSDKAEAEAKLLVENRPDSWLARRTANQRMSRGWMLKEPPITKLRFRAQKLVGKMGAISMLTGIFGAGGLGAEARQAQDCDSSETAPETEAGSGNSTRVV
jgi:hypothetical protein